MLAIWANRDLIRHNKITYPYYYIAIIDQDVHKGPSVLILFDTLFMSTMFADKSVVVNVAVCAGILVEKGQGVQFRMVYFRTQTVEIRALAMVSRYHWPMA